MLRMFFQTPLLLELHMFSELLVHVQLCSIAGGQDEAAGQPRRKVQARLFPRLRPTAPAVLRRVWPRGSDGRHCAELVSRCSGEATLRRPFLAFCTSLHLQQSCPPPTKKKNRRQNTQNTGRFLLFALAAILPPVDPISGILSLRVSFLGFGRGTRGKPRFLGPPV